MMNKLRKKSASNRSLDKAASEGTTSPPPSTPPSLDFVLPESSFRSSLILPDLGRRFSLLAQANQPELIKAKLADLRREGGDCLTEEEEDLVLRELKQLHDDRTLSRTQANAHDQHTNNIASPSSSSSSLRARFPSPIDTTTPSLSRSGSTGQDPASSPSDVVKSPSSRSLFGGSNRDAENIRRARKTSTAKSVGDVASPARRRFGSAADSAPSNSTAHTAAVGSEPALGSPASIYSTTGPSPFFASTIEESAEPSEVNDHASISTTSLSPVPTSRSSKRKSLLDSLSPEQKKRVSSTLSEIERSFFNTPVAANGISVNGLPSPNELSRVSSSSRSLLASVAEPLEEDDDQGPVEGLTSTPVKTMNGHVPRSASATSSLASVASGAGSARVTPRTHRGTRSGSISATEGRITGYIPGMPRPITPQSRVGSIASSTSRYQPVSSQTSPQMAGSPSTHLRSPSMQSPRGFDLLSGSTSPASRFESYASSSLSSSQFSDEAESASGQHDHSPAMSGLVPSSFESSHTIVDAMGGSTTRLSDERSAGRSSTNDDRSRQSLTPSPEAPMSGSPVAFTTNGVGRTTPSSHGSSHQTSLRKVDSNGRDDLGPDGHISTALDSSVSLGSEDGIPGPSVGLVDSSRASSSYGDPVPTALGLSQFHPDDQEEFLASRRSSCLTPGPDGSSASPMSETYLASTKQGPPPSHSSMAMHGHDPRYSMFSGHQSSFRDSFEDRHPSRPTSSVFSAPVQSALEQQSHQLHPLHQSVYLEPPRGQQDPSASQESLGSSTGSSFHAELLSSGSPTEETDRGVSVLIDNGRQTSSWDEVDGPASASSPRDRGADLETLGGLTLGEVLAIQQRLVLDRLQGNKGESVGGVGLGGAALLLGRPVQLPLTEGYTRAVGSEDAQDVDVPPSQSTASFTTAGSEYSETFPQVHHPAPTIATSHRSHSHSHSSSAVGFHRPRPSQPPAPVQADVTSTTPPSSPRTADATTPIGVPTTPSTPKTSQFSPATPQTPFSPAAIADPEFISDYRAKIDAADATIRELKKSPSMPKIGLRARTKSIKRKPKISSPQLISTTARVNTTDLTPEGTTRSLGPSSGSSVSDRFRRMTSGASSVGRSKDRPQTPPPIPSPTQPAFFARPSVGQVAQQASEPRPAFVFPVKAPVSTVTPPSPKPTKPKRSFLAMLRSKKSSEVTALPPAPNYGPMDVSAPSPWSAPLPDSPVVDITHPADSSDDTFAGRPAQVESHLMTRESSSAGPSSEQTSSGQLTARTTTSNHTPGSKEEGSVHAFFDAAQKLGIDPAEVDQLLQRSTSSATRKYSSIRSNSISNSIDLASPTLSREVSKRSIVGGGINLSRDGSRERLQLLRAVSTDENGGLRADGQHRPSPLNLSASVRSALDRKGSTRSTRGGKASGSVLRRTIIFASEPNQNRVSSYRDTGHQGEFEVISEGIANDGTGPSGGGMPSPIGSKFSLLSRNSISSSLRQHQQQQPRRSPSESSFFRGAPGPVPTPGSGPPESPSETSFTTRPGRSSTHGSLYDLYYDEDPGAAPPPIDPNQEAVEILELANGDVVYSVLQGLRDGHMDLDDMDEMDFDNNDNGMYDDDRSDAASTMDRPQSSLMDEPVQLTFRGEQRGEQIAPPATTTRRGMEPMRSVFNKQPARLAMQQQQQQQHHPRARPETKIFYSSSRQVADLIAEISRSHDAGSLQFANTPSPTTTTHPSLTTHTTHDATSSPSFAPLNLPKRSVSIRRPVSGGRRKSVGTDRGVSDAPSEMSIDVETNLDRLMGSLLQPPEDPRSSRLSGSSSVL